MVFVSAENTEKTEKEKTTISAENTTVASDLQALIQQLQSQIKELQAQIAELKAQMATAKEEIKITKELYKGVSGDEVKEVQKFLKQFSEIYPEGLVTGYYGPLTEKAVKKFQEREGLAATGKIDEITRKNINEYLVEGDKKVVICHFTSDNSGDKQTLEISKSALEAHLAHGDTLGACEQTVAPPTATTPAVTPSATTPASEGKPTPTISPVSLETEADFQKEISTLQQHLSTLSLGTSEYDSVLGKIASFQKRLAKLKVANTLINSDIIQIVSGVRNLCVLTNGGLVYCQNQNDWLKKEYNPDTITVNTFTVVPGLTDVASIMVGEYFACAVKKDKSVYCWGPNGYGQLGDGTFIDKMDPVQVFGLGPGTTVSISLGSIHACALKTDGSVVCWGSNDSLFDGGQIGDGTKEIARPKPTQVIGLGSGSTSALFSNYFGTCAVKTDNSIVCWGAVHANEYSGANKPVKISKDLGAVKSLSLGFKNTCALKTDGSVVCWGLNYCGQLGNETKTSTGIPTQVIGLGSGSTVAIDNAGAGYFRSALKTNGSVVSWGCGAPGDGKILGFNRYSPFQVSGLSAGTTAAISDNAPCALKTDGSVVCWYEQQGGLPTSVPGLK